MLRDWNIEIFQIKCHNLSETDEWIEIEVEVDIDIKVDA